MKEQGYCLYLESFQTWRLIPKATLTSSRCKWKPNNGAEEWNATHHSGFSVVRYRQKAQEDFEAVNSRVQDLLTSVGLLADAIDEREIEEFCKHAAYVKVIRYRTLDEELMSAPNTTDICECSWVCVRERVKILNWTMLSAMARRERSTKQYCSLHRI
jgi:hypothetical protein